MPLKSIQLGGVFARGAIFPKLTGTARYRGPRGWKQDILIQQVGWHREQSAPRPKG
ncbi:hypothetical protein NST33_02350 [Paenibacillus sp. FSL L8-0435]|uniref:hypothetical protein n=1 Tax=Paenibacillus sp. FSL L8-0435 TaxID=2954618 RepID=UPI0030DB8FBD